MRTLFCLVIAILFVPVAQGQAFIPTVTTDGGIELWEEMQIGVTLMGSQSRTSHIGGASAIYLGRYNQAAYVGPTFRLTETPAQFSLLTSAGVSRFSSSTSSRPDAPSTSVYPFSSMVGLVFQDDARALLVGIEYSPGYELSSQQNRPFLKQYEHAQQKRLVIGLGWSL